jgi:flavin-dependent dehydrogenase
MDDAAYDAVVVGGRVAGSTTAALLGMRGVRVLLVERVAFPRSTISTHFFRGAGLVAVLERLGILERVLALGPPRLTREFSYGFADDPEEGAPQDPGAAGFCLSVRRAPLDALLLEVARAQATVDVAQPASVSEVLHQDGRIVGLKVRESGREREVRAKIVIGADGRHSLVARSVGALDVRHEAASRTLYYRYVRGWTGPDGGAPDAPEFSLRGDELAYIFPSDGGTTCVAISLPKAEFPVVRADPNGELERRLAVHGRLVDRLRRSEVLGRTEGGPPEASWIRQAAGPGWALVGDAGIHQDPWTGLGMDMAGTHATFAANAIGDWLAGGTGEAEALASYRQQRDEHASPAFEETTKRARDLSVLG